MLTKNSINIVWSFGGRIAIAVLAILVTSVMTRILPQSDLGNYFLAYSIVAFAATFVQFGLTQSSVRLIAEADGNGNSSLSNEFTEAILFISILLASFAAAIIVLSNSVLRDALHTLNADAIYAYKLEIAIWIFLLSLQGIVSEIYRGYQHLGYATLSGGLITNAVCVLGLVSLSISVDRVSLTDVLLVQLLSLFFSLSMGYSLIKKKLFNIRLKFYTIKAILKCTWPIWINNVFVALLSQSTVLVIAFAVGSDDLAEYGIANRIAAMFAMVSGMLYSYQAPIIALLFSRGELARMERMIRAGAGTNALIMLLPLLMCILLPATVLQMVFGVQYAESGAILQILVISSYVNLATGLRGAVLLMCGYERIQLVIAIISGLLNLCLVYIGAIYGGVQYAALGGAIAVILQCIFEIMAVKKYIKIWTFPSFNPGHYRF